MAFISSKLRKVILSGVMAAGMGVVPANGVFTELGMFSRSLAKAIVGTLKVGSTVALTTKVGSTAAFKAQMINPDELTQTLNKVDSWALANNLDKGTNFAKKCFVCSVESKPDNNGQQSYVISNNNLPEMVKDAGALLGTFAVDKVLDGFCGGKNEKKPQSEIVVKSVPNYGNYYRI